MAITDSLSESSRKDWPQIYKRLTGKEWDNPTDKECESELESLEEMEQIMKEPGRGAWHE